MLPRSDRLIGQLENKSETKKGKCRGSPIQFLLLTSPLSDQAALKRQPGVEENKLISVVERWILTCFDLKNGERY